MMLRVLLSASSFVCRSLTFPFSIPPQGAVNLSMDTMAVPDGAAAALLVAYMAAVCAVATARGGGNNGGAARIA
jgi:hypothetical protein